MNIKHSSLISVYDFRKLLASIIRFFCKSVTSWRWCSKLRFLGGVHAQVYCTINSSNTCVRRILIYVDLYAWSGNCKRLQGCGMSCIIAYLTVNFFSSLREVKIPMYLFLHAVRLKCVLLHAGVLSRKLESGTQAHTC
jgi:hypothetical protein